MNTKNNRRRKASVEKIEKEFISLLQTRPLSQITVSEICAGASLNRSTFYANFVDVYALADAMRDKLASEVAGLYSEREAGMRSNDTWLTLLYHIKENQAFYNTYFKLGYDNQAVDLDAINEASKYYSGEHLEYHIEFFKAGFNALVKKWLSGGCKESPEEINGILKLEYSGRK